MRNKAMNPHTLAQSLRRYTSSHYLIYLIYLTHSLTHSLTSLYPSMLYCTLDPTLDPALDPTLDPTFDPTDPPITSLYPSMKSVRAAMPI